MTAIAPSASTARGTRRDAPARLRPRPARRRRRRSPPTGSTGFLEAVARSGSTTSAAIYWAGRATLCSAPGRHRALRPGLRGVVQRPRRAVPRTPPATPRAEPCASASLDDAGRRGRGRATTSVRARLASATEVLRHRDVATLSPAEKAPWPPCSLPAAPAPAAPAHRAGTALAPRRRRRRRAPCARSCAGWASRPRSSGGAAAPEPRRVVMLIDVSGSMSSVRRRAPSAGPPLGAAGRANVEVFTMGTRLTHVTRRAAPTRPRARPGRGRRRRPGLVRRHPAGRVAQGVPRPLGSARAWPAAPSSSSSVTAGSAAARALGEQMRRLRGSPTGSSGSTRTVARTGYQPVQQGIVAALPHFDDFVAGHSLAAFEELAEVVARA